MLIGGGVLLGVFAAWAGLLLAAYGYKRIEGPVGGVGMARDADGQRRQRDFIAKRARQGNSLYRTLLRAWPIALLIIAGSAILFAAGS